MNFVASVKYYAKFLIQKQVSKLFCFFIMSYYFVLFDILSLIHMPLLGKGLLLQTGEQIAKTHCRLADGFPNTSNDCYFVSMITTGTQSLTCTPRNTPRRRVFRRLDITTSQNILQPERLLNIIILAICVIAS